MAMTYNAAFKLYLSLANNSLGSDVESRLVVALTNATSIFSVVPIVSGPAFALINTFPTYVAALLIPQPDNAGTVYLAGSPSDSGVPVAGNQPIFLPTTSNIYMKGVATYRGYFI